MNSLAFLIAQRRRTRAQLLAHASDEEFDSLSVIFAHADLLGRLLHHVRQCLEEPLPHLPLFPDADTVLLWERGLLLPDEITSGTVTALVRWYVDRLRKQRNDPPDQRLSRDVMALYGELFGDPTHTSPI